MTTGQMFYGRHRPQPYASIMTLRKMVARLLDQAACAFCDLAETLDPPRPVADEERMEAIIAKHVAEAAAAFTEAELYGGPMEEAPAGDALERRVVHRPDGSTELWLVS